MKKTTNPYLAEIEAALSLHPRRTSAQNPESYIGGGQSKLRYIGLRVPHLRQTLKAGFSFSSGDPGAVAKVWDRVWQESDCFEVMSLALDWFYEPKSAAILEKHWPMLREWSQRVDNWAHSDTLCGIYARILERNPGLVYPTLQRWNTSRNPWLRRISLVSLLYYSSARKEVLPLPKILTLVEPQLGFDDYYVQKGVGWTLREAGNVYPQETYRFLEKNIQRLSAQAFSSATEKLAKPRKDRLKALRRAGKVEKAGAAPRL